jgi:hypothetical protein
MRLASWSLAVGAALFVSGIAFIVAAARTTQAAEPAEPVIETVEVGSIKQIMEGITGPAATVIYEAVGTVSSARGIEEIAPKNDEEWARVANNAVALAESGNLLLIGRRVVDQEDLVKMSHAMIAAAQSALKAAEGQDKEGILNAGAALYETCENCHAKYQRQ